MILRISTIQSVTCDVINTNLILYFFTIIKDDFLSYRDPKSPSIYLHEGASYDQCSDSLGQLTAHSLQLDPCWQHTAVFFLITEKLSVHIEYETYLLGKSYFFADKWVVKLPFLKFCSELVCSYFSDSPMQ